MNSTLLLTVIAGSLAFAPSMKAQTDYAPVITTLETAIQQEMSDWGITGVACALTDGTRVVHTAGFGEAESDSVFRAGSISKLFNAIAVMQRVEAGKLDLDAPVSEWQGIILPQHPFPAAPSVTLRQLLSHRSGLQRESPVGHYLDPSEPTLEATGASLADCVLATPPAERTRYSNIAPSVAGLVVARETGLDFVSYQRDRVLAPLGMNHSAWLRREVPGGRVIDSHMRIADGKGAFFRSKAPLFDLGTVPAGNLFTTAPDLARLVIELAHAMRGESTLLRPTTFAEMWRPQLDPAGSFGLGFSLGRFRGHRTVGHSGAVYGHSTALVFLPEVQLGVVVLANEDIVNARVGRLTDLALSLLLEAKTGEKPPPPAAPPSKQEPPSLDACAGRYESQSFWAELCVEQGRLVGDYASQPCTLAPQGGLTFLLNSRLHAETPVEFRRGEGGRITGFTVGAQLFERVPAAPAPLPEAWRRYVGVYGPDFIPLVVHEKFGHLYATTENMVDYRLTPVNRHVFSLPPGMYTNEFAVFLCNEAGDPHAVDFASMTLARK